MTLAHKDWYIGYRSKGPEGSQATCALMFSNFILQRMVVAARYCLELDDTNTMVVSPHMAGFKMNFKPGSSKGEINVAWAHLERAPADETGKGRLPCSLIINNRDRSNAYLRVSITQWKGFTKGQPGLFEPVRRILIPHDSVGTGGVKDPLFSD